MTEGVMVMTHDCESVGCEFKLINKDFSFWKEWLSLFSLILNLN